MNLTKIWLTTYQFDDIQLRADFGGHLCDVALRGLDPESVSDALMKMASMIRHDPTLYEDEMNDEVEVTLPLFCRKCDGVMAGGVAMQGTLTGVPDFPGGAVTTVSPGGSGRLVACLKCVECGYSVSVGSSIEEVGEWTS